MKNCWNFTWLKKKVSVTVSWEGKTVEHLMHVDDYIEKIDLPRKVYCNQCTDTVSYSSSGKKGLPALCSVLPPASNVGVLCFKF